jgi:hypothetical protein
MLQPVPDTTSQESREKPQLIHRPREIERMRIAVLLGFRGKVGIAAQAIAFVIIGARGPIVVGWSWRAVVVIPR